MLFGLLPACLAVTVVSLKVSLISHNFHFFFFFPFSVTLLMTHFTHPLMANGHILQQTHCSPALQQENTSPSISSFFSPLSSQLVCKFTLLPVRSDSRHCMSREFQHTLGVGGEGWVSVKRMLCTVTVCSFSGQCAVQHSPRRHQPPV